MIKIPTVLIMGAGASSHLGYPLGNQLMSDICALRESAKLAEIIPDGLCSLKEANAFLLRLSRAGYESIDAFLESCRDEENLVELGKFLIARTMKGKENEDLLFLPYNPGWYAFLFRSLLGSDLHDFSMNCLSIITFNYDRSLECYLHHAAMYRFKVSSDAAWQAISRVPVIHVHGILGRYPEVPYTTECTPPELRRISREIKIVHELGPETAGFCSEDFQRAYETLMRAKRIYFLGFGFHEDNLRRLKFFKDVPPEGVTIATTTTGLTEPKRQKRIRERLIHYHLTEKNLSMVGGYGCNAFFDYVADLE